MTLKERLIYIEEAAKMMTLSRAPAVADNVEPLTAYRGDPAARADDLLVKAVDKLPISDDLYGIVIALRESWDLPLA